MGDFPPFIVLLGVVGVAVVCYFESVEKYGFVKTTIGCALLPVLTPAYLLAKYLLEVLALVLCLPVAWSYLYVPMKLYAWLCTRLGMHEAFGVLAACVTAVVLAYGTIMLFGVALWGTPPRSAK